MPYANTPAGRKKRIEDRAKKTGNLFKAADEIDREDALELVKRNQRKKNESIIKDYKKTNPVEKEQTKIEASVSSPIVQTELDYYSGLSKNPEYKAIVKGTQRNPAVIQRNAMLNGSALERFTAQNNSKHAWDVMTPEEIDNYTYLYGKFGVKEAEDYAKYLDADLNLRKAAREVQAKETMFEGHPILEGISDTGMAVKRGTTNAFRGMTSGIIKAFTGDETPREQTWEDVYVDLLKEDSEGLKKLALDMSEGIGYMAPSIAAGVMTKGALAPIKGASAAAKAGGTVGGLVNAGSAGGNAYLDAIAEGKEVDDARLYALATGGMEAATNKLLGGIGAIGGGTAKRVLGGTAAGKAVTGAIESGISNPNTRRNVMKGLGYLTDAASEGLEEYTQELLDKGARNLIFGENNEINLADPDALYSGLLGTATAGVLNIPGMAADASYDRQIRHLGEQSNIESYQDFADSMETNREAFENDQEYDSVQKLYQMAQNLAEKQNSGNLTVYDKGEFENEVQRYVAETAQNLSNQGDRASLEEDTVNLPPEQEKSQQMADNDTESRTDLNLWSKQFEENGKKAFESGFDQEGDINGYYKGFANYYNAGRYNMEMKDANKAAASIFLSPEQASEAYKAGVLDRNAVEPRYNKDTKLFNGMEQGQQKEGGLSFAAENATEAQKNVASVLGKRTGLQFELTDGFERANETAEYGKGKIRISANAKDFNASASHELTHFIQDYSPDMYQIYKDQAVKTITQAEGIDLENMIESYTERYRAAGQELSRDKAMDEIVADATEKFLNDPEYVDAVVRENRTLGQKILDFIEDMVESLKELMKTGPSRHKAAQALESNLEAWETARTYWMQGLQEAGDRYKSGVELNGEASNKTEIKQENEGIRYQLEEVEDYQEDTKQLIKENETLKKVNEYLKKQFELTSKEELRQGDIKKVSRKILKTYNSKMKEETLTRNLTRLYEYIRSTDQIDGKELSEVASDIGRSILNQSSQKDATLETEYKDLRRQIRNTKISITEQDKQDLAAMGGYEAFRKKYFGSMKLGADGISVDSLYQELAAQHPDLFDVNITHPADQLMQIGNILDLTKAQVQNPYHANMEEMSYLVGQELLEEYYNVRQPAPTFADRKAAELEKAKRNYKKQIEKFKTDTVSQYQNLLAEQRKENRNLKDIHKTELLARRMKFDQKMEKRRESLRRQEARKQIFKERNKLQKWLLEPTDKQHIPEELRATVASFLNSIDFSSKEDNSEIKTQRTRDWLKAQAAFKSIIESGKITDDNGNEHWIDVDPDMAARILELENKVQGIDKLENLDAYHMEELQKVVTTMRKTLTEINSMKSNTRYGEASLLAEDVFRDTENLKAKKEYTALLGVGKKLITVDMLDPQTMFKKLGPAMETTYKSLRKGLDKKTTRLREAADYFDKAVEESGVSRKEIRRWTGIGAKTFKFEVQQYDGAFPTKVETIEMTIPQLMSLYELNKRGQARGHICGQGIRPDGIKKGVSLDNRTVGLPTVKKGGVVKVKESDVTKMLEVLTPEQKKLADALQRFMGNQVAEWGNETSMEMYGYKKFAARDYFPIKTDRNHITREEGAMQNSAIRNLGFTKSTQQNAKNPLILEDIFDVFTRQVDQMSSYNAYVLPLSDLHKVLNYKDMRNFNGSSVRAELERAHGQDGVKYVENLIDDINGMDKKETDIFSYFIANMKTSAVAGNLRVAIQQPTAIARATAEIDPKYLAMGATRLGTKWETITKYAPIAQWKDWGFYQMQTSRQMKDVIAGSDSAKQRLVNKTMFLAEQGDKIAWKRLWNAVESETLHKHPELTDGSEEFYQAVGERFSEIVDKTQVADSVLHRTQIMRSKNGTVKEATAFLAEPLKSYNMLYRAYLDNAMGTPGAKKILARTASAYAASAFLTAAAASAIDALRDKEKELPWMERYKKHFWSNFSDNIIILKSVPFVKDVISVGEGYDLKRSYIQGFEEIKKTVDKLGKFLEGDSKYTPAYLFVEAAKSLSTLTGIPAKNIARDAEAIIAEVSHAVGGEQNYKWVKQTYDISSEDNLTMYVNMLMEAEETGNGSLAKTIEADLKKAGIPEEKIQGRIESNINKTIREEIDIEGAALNYDTKDKASKEAFQKEVKAYIELKKRAGWDEEKSLKQVRSMLTEIYKPQYQAAKTQKEREAIIKRCKSFFYNGNSIYKDYKFATNWKKK